MNFRIALIPVFIVYGLWEMYSQYIRKNYKETFLSILIVLISLLSYIPVMEFSFSFASINSDYNLVERIIYNIVLALGYRESIGISGEILILEKWTDVLSFFASLILIAIHLIGTLGIIKFSFKQDKSILIIFTYLLLPILAIAHMRYLLPLIPILLFGFSYIFFRNPRE